jgi:hypothetical protein
MYLPVLDKTNHNQEYNLSAQSPDFEYLCKFCILPTFIASFLGFAYIENSLKLAILFAFTSQVPILILILSNRLLGYRKLKKHLISRRYRLKVCTFQDIINDTLADIIVSLAFDYEDGCDPCSRLVIAEYQRSNLPPFQSAEENRICEIFPLIKGDIFKTPYGMSLQIVEIEKDVTDDSVTGVTLEVTNFRRFSIIWKIF